MFAAKEITFQLNSIIKVDVDASGAYEKAIKAINNSDIKKKLLQFKKDHIRHIDVLSRIIQDRGDLPFEFEKDIEQAVFTEGFTAIIHTMDIKKILKAMLGNEHLTNKRYLKSLSYEADISIKKILEDNYKDEQTHLLYIEKILKTII